MTRGARLRTERVRRLRGTLRALVREYFFGIFFIIENPLFNGPKPLRDAYEEIK